MATYTELENEKQKQSVERIADPAYSTDHRDYLGQYNDAMDRLNFIKQNLPTYDASYDRALQDLFDEITGYEKFRYNTREDTLYQAYKQSYTDAGRLAMQDTMGQAAALTGGYGSSYSQTAGQQQYSAYLQKLNEVLPETYGMAYRQYWDEKDALQDRYAMTGQLAEEEYQKYQDLLNAYYQELDYWQEAADTAHDRYQYADEQAYDREQDAYKKQQDAYDRLAELIMATGYKPNKDELSASGMSEGHMKAYLNYYKKMGASSSSGGGGRGGSGGSAKKNTQSSLFDRMLSDAKALIDKGKSVEEVNGSLSNNAVENGLSISETSELMKALTEYAIATGKL